MVRTSFALLAFAPLMLAGCAVGPNYHRPEPATLGVPDAFSTPSVPGVRPELEQWWTSFNDPQLNAIVELALKQNLDVAQAVSRLRQAREQLIQQNAGLFPTVSANAGYSRNIEVRGRTFGQITNAGIVNENYVLSADASYQVDLFGGVRRGIEGARGSLQSSGYSLAQVRASVASEVARNYILLRAAQANAAIARGSLALQDDNLEIAGFRVQAGLVSGLDAEQVRAQRAQTATQVPTFDQSFEQAANRLGVLTGQAPGALKEQLRAIKPIPKGPDAVPVGLPADLIRMRPDVRVAERNLAAATAQIGVAKAQLFPQLTLGTSINTNASSIDLLTNIITGRVFGQLAQTIFDAGRNRAVVRQRRAAAEQAFGAYKAAVLTALEDVENALTALATAQRRQRDFMIAAEASENAALLARSRYRAGLTDVLTLNTAETSLLTAQNGLAQAKSDQAQALVRLYLALGGGWDADGPVPTAPPLKHGDGQPAAPSSPTK
ncbi:efflux transporter outer membrane subunit [Sphingomonas sp.]|uniref:efflux transporter outer membrane subunit n=1 Tax=Sphingomonas sp. TaxID=28214 RepID=UPI0025EE5375|nr:efflux transporter outer membrane subunit [Sphingomonas sp.]